jgi:CHAD domain-containing protein/uncharacterized protein YjbK
VTDHLEIEHKYQAGPDLVLPDLADLPGCAAVSEPEIYELVAQYFDTDDFRLASRGITLRRREGGTDAGWHLKLPTDSAAERQELHAPLGKSTRTVPARLATLVAGHTRGRRLRPVATLRTRRTVLQVLGAEAAVLAEVADDEVTGQVTGAEAAPSWREIEVELGSGPSGLLDGVGRRLREAGAEPAGYGSKVGRLLGDRVPVRAALKYRTAGDAVTSYLVTQLDAVLYYDPRVRLGEYDSVHQMRVAVRRIRSILRTCSSLFEETEPLGTELKWLADELGTVRDLEVLHERFSDRLTEIGEDTAPWLVGLGAQHRAAVVELNKVLRLPRYFEVIDALVSFVADPPLTEAAARKAQKALPKIVRKTWHRLDRKYREVETADDPGTARHAARKAAKRARYTADATVPVLGRPAKKLAKQCKRIQTTLGDYQDSLVAQETLAELNTGGEEAFTLGVLSGLERCSAAQALHETTKAWKKASKPKYIRALQ